MFHKDMGGDPVSRWMCFLLSFPFHNLGLSLGRLLQTFLCKRSWNQKATNELCLRGGLLGVKSHVVGFW
jgi:hypothetical protein